jgi:hypothetical protein
MRRTIPGRKASARTSIVTRRPSRRTRTAWTVRTGERSVAAEGPEVVPAFEDRPGRAIAAMSSGTPHPERLTLAKRAARPVPDGVAVSPGTAPHSGG